MKARSLSAADVSLVLESLDAQLAPATPVAIRLREEHSNLVGEVDFDDGRALMIKKARYPKMAGRFATSRLAARWLREQCGVVAPIYLDVPGEDGTTLAYWRIPLLTLDELWSDLDAAGRRHALRSWGALVARIERPRMPGHGELVIARNRRQSLKTFLARDLWRRLHPAACDLWPAATPVIEGLATHIDAVHKRAGAGGGVLVHNDLFAANLLCERTAQGEVTCAGVIDLEDAFAGPPEAEMAKIEVLHSPLFGQPKPAAYVEGIRAGLGAVLDPMVEAFFRIYHLLNMGYHAAAIGLADHAHCVLETCRGELASLPQLREHRERSAP